jgi:PBP1b-binding outer membrane lipoprotein LpoB
MRMKKFLAVLFLLPILLVGCIKVTSTNKSYGNILSTACNGYMALEAVTSLKSTKVISIDVSAIPNVKDSDKDIITKQLKKKSNTSIKFDSLDKLQSDGIYDKQNKYLDGVLFTISKVDKITENDYAVTASIYHSGDTSTDAICTVKYLNGTWHIINTEIPKKG